MIHDALVKLASVNLSQLEFAAWLEISALCLVRVFYLRRMLEKGSLPLKVAIGPRRMVLLCMILLGFGSMIGNAVVILHGSTGWGASQIVWVSVGKAFRIAAVYLYIRTITYDRDRNRLWLLMLAAALLFAIFVRDR